MNGILCLLRGHRPGALRLHAWAHGDGKMYETTLRACERCGIPVFRIERALEGAVLWNPYDAHEELKTRISSAVSQLDELLVDTEEIKAAVAPKKQKARAKLRRHGARKNVRKMEGR